MKKVFILLLVLLVCPLAVLAADKVEINTATLQQLDEITGVGPALAQRIVDARPFSSVNDLLKVKGIGEKTLQKIKDQGLAYVISNSQYPISNETNSAAPGSAQSQTTNQAPPEPPPAQPGAAITYPDGVIINELMPSPAGADETDEWIELYNKNSTPVDVSGWKLQDTQGTSGSYVFPAGANISANAYLVLKRPDTNILLNNESDGLNLLQPDGKIVDSVNYTSAPKNQSYNNSPTGWKWSILPTPGSTNTITSPASAKASASKALPKSKKTDSKVNIDPATLASLNDSLPGVTAPDSGTQNPWLLFSAALVVAIISAVIILLLKLKVFRKPISNT